MSMTLRQCKQSIQSRLEGFGIEPHEASTEAELILEHVTGLHCAQQRMLADQPIESQPYEQVEAIVAQRAQRVPLQYCFGYGWFFGEKYLVKPGVFIPRSDTETLVDVAEKLLRVQTRRCETVGEIGTGSGVVAISLLKKFQALTVISCDVNESALDLAQENAVLHNVADRLRLVHGDWQIVLPENLDAIVSNPPYIPISQRPDMQPEVRDHEPHTALFGGGNDGLDFYRQLSQLGKQRLRDGRGFIGVEVGDGQSDAVAGTFLGNSWVDCTVHCDLNGLPRVVSAIAL
jgi:release factor glutamine methyltransferase